MKTKHLFLAMALPLAFAACTSEEIIENAQDQNLDARKALGEVELVFGDEVNSRMTAEGGNIGFVVGDGVGACLVDVYSKNADAAKAAVAINNYLLTDYIQTNYQYKYDGSSWATTARMVEGNYVFYAPYNGEHLARTAIKTGVNNVQNLTLAEDGTIDKYSALDEFLKSGQPAYVGYKFLKAQGQELRVSVDMKPIYAYPLITLDNSAKTAEEDIIITKVVFASSQLISEAAITVGGKGAIAAANAEGVVGNLFDQGATAAKNGSWVKSLYMLENRTNHVVDEANAKKANVITVNMPEGGYKVEAGETASFHAVLPAMNYTDLKVYAYTADGEAYQLSAADMAVNFAAGKIYPTSEYNATTGVAYSTTKGGKMTLKLTESNHLTAVPVIVSTTEELVSAVASAGGPVAITLGSENVKLTDAVIAAANPNILYTIKNPISVAGGTADKAMVVAGFNFEGKVTIESGNVVFKATDDPANILVKKGASFQLYTANAETAVEVEKDANLTIGSGSNPATSGNPAAVYLKKLINKGNTTINAYSSIAKYDYEETAEAPSAIQNSGTITNKAAELPTVMVGSWINEANVTIASTTGLHDGTFSNKGTLNIDSSKKFNLWGSILTNETTGTIVNKGTIGFNASYIGADGSREISTLNAKGMFGGSSAIKVTEEGRINVYPGCDVVTAFDYDTVGEGVIAYVVETWNETITGANAPKLPTTVCTDFNMLSVKNLTLGSASENILVTSATPAKDIVPTIELQDGGVFHVTESVTFAEDKTINLLGSATIKGTKTITVSSGKTLDINVPALGTLTTQLITISGTVTIDGYAETGDYKSTWTNSGAVISATTTGIYKN